MTRITKHIILPLSVLILSLASIVFTWHLFGFQNNPNFPHNHERKFKDAKEIYNTYKDSIAKIYTFSQDGGSKKILNGTGFLTYLGEPKIITSKHVVSNQKSIIALNKEKVWIIKSWTEHPTLDVALLNLEEEKRPYSPTLLEIDTDYPVKPGDIIYTLGHPLGYGLTIQHGIVNAIDGSKIVFSAPLSEGASGSPLINEMGKVIGICDSYFLNAQNYNIATPTSLAFLTKDWIEKTYEPKPELEKYLNEIAKSKKKTSTKSKFWEDMTERTPEWTRWVTKTDMTRVPTQEAIEQATLSFWFVDWGSISDEDSKEKSHKSAQLLSNHTQKLKELWETHKENLNASRELKPNESKTPEDSILKIDELVVSFNNVAKEFVQFLDEKTQKEKAESLSNLIQEMTKLRENQERYRNIPIP